jgi:hypothetical protein
MCRRGPRSLLHVKEGACLLMGDSRARLVSFPSFKGGGVAFLLLGNWWACPFSSYCRGPSCCRGTGGLVPFRPFSSDSRWPSCCWGTGGLVPFLPTAGGLPAAGELVGLSLFVPFLPTPGGLPAAGELVGLSLFFQLPVAFLLLGNSWACPVSSKAGAEIMPACFHLPSCPG